MLSFEEAAAAWTRRLKNCRREIFDGLNGGVNLLPDKRVDAEGFLLLGMYIVDQTGRRWRSITAPLPRSTPRAPMTRCAQSWWRPSP